MTLNNLYNQIFLFISLFVLTIKVFGMVEYWRPVKGFESKYEVSSLGKVKSIGTYNTCKKGIMVPMVDTSGYEHVRLYSGGKVIDKSVHRLVAETFLPNPDNFFKVCKS